MHRIFLPLVVSVTLAACSTPKEGTGASSTGTTTPPVASVPVPMPMPSMPEHAHPGGDAMAQPHQDHEARHGGVLTMEGDGHVEIVVSSEGVVDLYASDGSRRPIPPKEVTGTVTLASKASKEKKQTLKLTEDSGKGSLSAKGPAPDDTEYTWNLQVRGAPMMTTLLVPAGGTAALGKGKSGHAAGDHAHGAPHGGVVQTLGDGHVEVKLEKTGDVTLWMLDAGEKPRTSKGVVASLRPVVAGAKDIKLTYDEKSDTLRGKLDPVTTPHIDAVLSITPVGGTASSLRLGFHLEDHAGHAGHEGH
jgi:hypothetical protein